MNFETSKKMSKNFACKFFRQLLFLSIILIIFRQVLGAKIVKNIAYKFDIVIKVKHETFAKVGFKRHKQMLSQGSNDCLFYKHCFTFTTGIFRRQYSLTTNDVLFTTAARVKKRTGFYIKSCSTNAKYPQTYQTVINDSENFVQLTRALKHSVIFTLIDTQKRLTSNRCCVSYKTLPDFS